jgi:hypothetical protein
VQNQGRTATNLGLAAGAQPTTSLSSSSCFLLAACYTRDSDLLGRGRVFALKISCSTFSRNVSGKKDGDE